MDNNTLRHHGILGMRWGVRRTKAQLRRARGPDSASTRVTKEQYEAAKRKAINSGDRETVEKWQQHLSNEELRKAVDRVDMMRKLNRTDDGALESGFDKVESVMDKVGRTTRMIDNGLGLYNVVAKINNTFNTKKLPTIDGEDASEKEAKSAKKKAEELETELARNYKQATRERTMRGWEQTDAAAAEATKRAAEATKRAAEEATRKATQKAEIKKLITQGKVREIGENYDSYDSDIIDEVIEELEKKQKFINKYS